MKTKLMNKKNKKEIKNFWNKKPCGTFGDIPDKINKEYFDKIKIRRYNLEPFILKEIERFNINNKKVLEIGCGVGTDGIELIKRGADYQGIDYSETSVSLAKKNFSLHNIQGNIKKEDAERLPFRENEFDFIYSWGVIHHTPDIKKAISEIKRVLKPQGEFLIMLYNRHSLVALQLYIIYGLLSLKPFISFKKLFAQYHESQGTQAYTKKELKKMFSEFKNIKIKTIPTPYDIRITRNKFLPDIFLSLVPNKFGFFHIIKKTKNEQ